MSGRAARRRLILLRHAKSDWSLGAEPDHPRPLNRRGRLAASLMGAWLAETAPRIDLALVSTAARTRETWARAAQVHGGAGETLFEDALYHAEPRSLRDRIAALPDPACVVLIIGHNPGLEDFVAALAARQALRMPTAAAAVFEAEEPWSAFLGAARLVAFETPKDLV